MTLQLPNTMSKRLFMIFSLLLAPLFSFAEQKAGSFPISAQELLLIAVLGILAFVLLVLAYAVYVFNVFLKYARPEGQMSNGLFDWMGRWLTDAVPVEQEETIMTDHVYDGIRELDNNLPLWWKYMFYATIVFSAIYIYYYHYSGSGVLQDQEYVAQMEQAEKDKEAYAKSNPNSINENNVKVLTSASVLAKGKQIFLDNCAACHGSDGGGKVGPNLTDNYWIHGNGIKNVFVTISAGVPGKMQAWKNNFSSSDIQSVANYVLTLKGTTPANPKAPEGTEIK